MAAATRPKLIVQVREAAWRGLAGLPVTARATALAAHAAAVEAGGAALTGEVTLAFADDTAIADLNSQFRGKDQPTNVLSFPDRNGGGDAIFAFETIAAEAMAQGKTLAAHTRHLIVHALLHLMGYDHMTQGDARRMERLERDILAGLGVADPYILKPNAPKRVKTKP